MLVSYFSPYKRLSLGIAVCLITVCLQSCERGRSGSEQKKQTNQPYIDPSHNAVKIISEDPERDVWQKPEKVIAKMGNLKGKTVVDIGAGTGYFTFQLANKADKVIATDIEVSFLDYINQRKQEYYPQFDSKIVTRLTEPTDPFIEPNEADWVLLVNTYDYLPNKIKYLSKVRRGLKANGCLILVDFKEQPKGKLKTEYPVISIGEISSNLSASGFSRITVDDTTLPYQYIITAFR